ncbi:alpha/beta fold hydrolase [Methanolobus profundi]|uniref:Pimeloyl-ACP methyl ester carboxylesterase n=1 Tax=Methanolobus profundi TaxID=487685 RepID=A0A1I4R9U9_9EURY|nr:alpha/beta hydrolase [Methanolobus profundi]SFM48989.1 Pimeloyl-ACP methyl ester carboxylesterase [Methanolobus profundi]
MLPNPRKYGTEPYRIAVIHGGPGAPGTVAELAAGLAGRSGKGVLEPLQTSMSIEGQISELKRMLRRHGKLPLTLVGHSWGAWLAFLFAARYPSYVKKLILIASGPFEEKYATTIMQTRLDRMSKEGIEEYLHLSSKMSDPSVRNKNHFFTRFGKLMSSADSFDLVPFEETHLGFHHDVNKSVWSEASYLRKSGKLLRTGFQIKCPVVAIHGCYDPHPFEGVEEPLSRVIIDLRFILLEKCGHYPWLERHASEEFYQLMEKEVI